MKVLTAGEMREVDRLTAERHGISALTLMENAGKRVLEYLVERISDLSKRRIVILCGKGNNGGDGLVVARLLKEQGAEPKVVLCAAPDDLQGDAAVNLSRLRELPADFRLARNQAEWHANRKELESADIIIDALLGTGLRGPVEGFLAEVICDLNRHRPRTEVVAVDIPSGISADSGEILGTAVSADTTITFTAPKIGQLLAPGSEGVGRLRVADIGSPRALIEDCSASQVRWLEPGEFEHLPLRRRPNTNKGTYGHLLVVAGSRGKTGAATMAGWAALRSGAGLVTIATAESELVSVGGAVPELMKAPLAETGAGSISHRCLEDNQFSDLLRGKNVLAMGPGLSMHGETQQFVRAVVANSQIPLILDADGLNAFAGRASELKRHATPNLVLTPHPGEMARLLDCSASDVQERRIETARRVAKEGNCFVILKGHQTVLAAPDGRAWVNSTGNPGMASGGTGDVLTGMLAGLVAQFGAAIWERALCLGVYLHGLAGDISAAEVGEVPLMASDVIGSIPWAYAQLLSEIERVED